MNIEQFINQWLEAANSFDTNRFLDMWHTDALLDDPSVGETFKGHDEIKRYFETYFIGYSTQTELIQLEILSAVKAHIEVEFTGEFPGGRIRGTLDFVFQKDQIISAKADLI